MQETVEGRTPHVRLADEITAAPSERRVAPPPTCDVGDIAPLFVYGTQRTVRNVAFGVCIECRDKLLEAIERHRVVAGRDIDELAVRRSDARVPAPRRAFARALPDAHPRFAP